MGFVLSIFVEFIVYTVLCSTISRASCTRLDWSDSVLLGLLLTVANTLLVVGYLVITEEPAGLAH